MHPLRFDLRNRISLLCLGAHADDIEIGCGGTILRLLDECASVSVTWAVFSADPVREAEARSSATEYLIEAAQACVLVFRFGEQLKREVEPDLILTHALSDAHQDHRTIAQLTQQTFRKEMVLGYEIPKVDGDLGTPTVFVPLSPSVAEEKVDLLLRHFATQAGKHWFDRELFLGLMRIRGMEAVAHERFAEAFTCRKLVVAP
jgi:LmbE family N-acetylglucosaminyl deacetylase